MASSRKTRFSRFMSKILNDKGEVVDSIANKHNVKVSFRVFDQNWWLSEGMEKLFDLVEEDKLYLAKHYFRKGTKVGYLWEAIYKGDLPSTEEQPDDLAPWAGVGNYGGKVKPVRGGAG